MNATATITITLHVDKFYEVTAATADEACPLAPEGMAGGSPVDVLNGMWHEGWKRVTTERPAPGVIVDTYAPRDPAARIDLPAIPEDADLLVVGTEDTDQRGLTITLFDETGAEDHAYEWGGWNADVVLGDGTLQDVRDALTALGYQPTGFTNRFTTWAADGFESTVEEWARTR